MHVHLVTSHAIHPVPTQDPMSPRHPVHLPQDLRAVLEDSGHHVQVHALPHDAAGCGSADDDGPDFAAAAGAGQWLADRIEATTGRVGHRDGVLMHALDDVAAATALVARGLTGVPVAVRGTCLPAPYRLRGARQVRQACLRAADAVVAPTAHDARGMQAAGVPRGRVVLVPDAVVVPPGDGSRRAPTRRVVSLTGAAGARVLVAAMRWAPDSELVVAGGSSEESARRMLGEAARLNLASRVRWAGWMSRTDAVDLIDTADVVACAGADGTRPTTAIEAMWRGRPVVAADLPGLTDAVAAGTTGLLAHPDDPRSLGAALRSLLDDPFRQEAFGQAGADRAAARYAPDLIAACLDRVYHAISSAAPRQFASARPPHPQPPALKEAG